MERVGAGRRRGRDDRSIVEEVEGVGAVGRRDDRPDPEPIGRSRDPRRDLAAVGDEEGADRGVGDRSAVRAGRVRERVNRVRRDTPSSTDPPGREPSGRDPALDAPRGRPDPAPRPRRAQLVRHRVAIVAYARRLRGPVTRSSSGCPARPALLVERAEALLGLLADALAGDDPRRVPLRRAVAQPADLADDRLGRPRRGRVRGQHVGDRRVDGRVERGLALDDLVDQPDPLGPDGIEPAATREQRAGVRLADLRDHERRDDRRQDPEPRLGEPEPRAGSRR